MGNNYSDPIEEYAKKEDVTAEEFCSGIEEAIDAVMQSDEPSAKEMRNSFQGRRPTVEEFVEYIVREIKQEYGG